MFLTGSHYHTSVSYTHLRAHETSLHLVCRLLLEKKKCMGVTTRQKHQLKKLSLHLALNNHIREQVNEHSHLGVIIDQQLSWEK